MSTEKKPSENNSKPISYKEKYANAKRPAHRPKFWTEDRIGTLAHDLIEWVNKDDSLALIQFCSHMMLDQTRIGELANKDKDFQRALLYAKAKLADRMISKVNKKPAQIHPAFFNKYIRLNDFILDQHLKDLEKEIGKDISNLAIKVLNYSKKEKPETKK